MKSGSMPLLVGGSQQGGRAISNRNPLVWGMGEDSLFASEFLPVLRGSSHSPPLRGGEKGEGVRPPLLFQTLATEKRIPPCPRHTPFQNLSLREKAGAPLLRHPGESRNPSKPSPRRKPGSRVFDLESFGKGLDPGSEDPPG